ncbi:hypothetical protein JCM3770_004391 [Rhodotorula araucariae]
MSLLVLSADDVAALTASLSADALCTMLAQTMAAIASHPPGALAIQNPQRIATESELHKTLYMPSRLTTSEGSATAIKVVAVPKPSCSLPGLPATTLLFDEATGLARAVVNAAELTGIRTAAASALATKVLADPSSTSLVVFGSGTQAYYHARLILQLFPSLTAATFVVRSQSPRVGALLDRLQPDFPAVSCAAVTSEQADDAVKGADIICTCVPSTEPLFAAASLKPGVHINAIGSYTPTMLEFPPSLITPSPPPPPPHPDADADADAESAAATVVAHIPLVLVDSAPACLAEAGELHAAHTTPAQLVELGTLLDPATGALDPTDAARAAVAALRGGPGGRSLFKCVGVGGMDVAIARLVVDEAERQGRGARVPF